MIARRAGLIAALLLAAVAGAYWYLSPDGENGRYYGYVEGEYVRLSAPVSGTLQTLHVARGDRVEQGAPLFAMDLTAATAERDQAAASLAEARAVLADRLKGTRAEEIEATIAQRAQAAAGLTRAEAEYARQQELVKDDFASRARLDEWREARDRAQARIEELDAAIAALRLPARDDQILAAEASVGQSEAALTTAERRLAEHRPVAPSEAMVEDTMFLPGEWVPANAVIVSLLPRDKRKLRFFVPQSDAHALQPGSRVAFACDGCPEGLTARVSYIAPEVEFTPPVIYSAKSRDKLVFLVEAIPEGAVTLPVGLPVDVEPLAP